MKIVVRPDFLRNAPGRGSAPLASGLHAPRPGCTLSCTFKSTMMRAVIASALVAAASAKTLYKEYAPPAPRPLRTLRRNALRPRHPTHLEAGLPRTFDDGWDKRWVTGAAGDKSLGEWKHTAGEYYGGDEAAAKGIETSDDMRHYFLATKMDEFSNKGSDLVIQYSLKYTKTPECGGSYIKLLGAGADPAAFDNDTPYRCVQPAHSLFALARPAACAA